jgi:endonuclease/exonuclease/phosphatase (EEP) superfamily protein YafD
LATPTLRAMLLNVNERRGDPARVKQVIQEMDPDIVVLVEISPKWIRDLQWLAISHPYSCVRPRDDNFGIGVFSKMPLADCEIVFIGEAHVPSIVATIDTPQGKLCVIATHPLPPGGAEYSRLRNDQLDQLPEHIPTSVPVMLLGDLNVTPWSSHFRRLLSRTRMIDSSKGRGVQPTWPNNNPFLRIPLDHCLHSSDIFVWSKTIGEDVGSDHYPVFIDFSIRNERNTVLEQK